MKTKENVEKSNSINLTKSGISLIVLVITIIVIIILSLAIIISLNNNNPVMEANRARYDSDTANMQAIFTNAVAKVMAHNRAVVSIKPGQINTVTRGVKETTGEVAYVLDNPFNEANTNGKIIFDKGTNKDKEYYTGRKLPIYAAGETKWFVDGEGRISLEIADNKYGNGIIVKLFLISGKEFNALIPSNTTSIIFTDEAAPSGATLIDVSQKHDQGIVAWFEGTTMKVSSQRTGIKIIANSDCSKMFSKCYNVKSINLSNLDTCEVTNMKGMFTNCTKLTNLDVSHFNTSNVTDMSDMFSECYNIKNLNVNSFDTSNVTDMSYMFSRCEELTTLNVNNFNTSNVTNMTAMFNLCTALKALDLSNFDTSNVTKMGHMFSGRVLQGSNYFQTYDMSLATLNISSFNTSKVTNMSYMFDSCRNLTIMDLSNFDTSNATDMTAMFKRCYSVKSNTAFAKSKSDRDKLNNEIETNSPDLSWRFKLGINENSSTMLVSGGQFGSMIPRTATSVVFTDEKAPLNTEVTDFSVDKDMGVTGWSIDTTYYISTQRRGVKVLINSNATAMFAGKNKITNIDFSNLDTSAAIDMTAMFNSCSGLTSLDLTNFNTEKVTTFASMFGSCTNLKNVNLSGLNVSNVTSMDGMFYNCASLQSIDLSSWSINDNVSLSSTFSGCTSIVNGQALAKTQSNVDKLNSSTGKPTTWNFIVK